MYCRDGEVAYTVLSQERDLGCVDIGATQWRVHGLLQLHGGAGKIKLVGGKEME
jgi:hypothetical protein